jgi:hypothetical protein
MATTTEHGDRLARRAVDLARLLDQQHGLYEQLLACLDARIAAMRCADWNAMSVCNDRERVVTQRISEREGLRRQLLRAIGRELRLPAMAARSLTVSQLADRLTAGQAVDVRQAAERLRPVLARVAQANRLAGFIARGIAQHLSGVLQAVGPRPKAGPAYGGDGTATRPSGALLFEATG